MFFQSDYNDLMPSAPESDAPPSEKTGLARFMEIIGSHGGTLLAVNLLFIAGCIPVVTIPLSLFAMNRVVRRVVQDKPVKCAQDFWEAFRDWKRGYLAFLLTVLPMGLAGCGMWFYMSYAAANPLFLLPFLVCSTIFLMVLLSSGCLYGFLDSGKSVRESVRLAALLSVVKPARTVPAALGGYGLLVLSVLFFPLSGVYVIVLGFSLPCLLVNFFLRVLMRQPNETQSAVPDESL